MPSNFYIDYLEKHQCKLEGVSIEIVKSCSVKADKMRDIICGFETGSVCFMSTKNIV